MAILARNVHRLLVLGGPCVSFGQPCHFGPIPVEETLANQPVEVYNCNLPAEKHPHLFHVPLFYRHVGISPCFDSPRTHRCFCFFSLRQGKAVAVAIEQFPSMLLQLLDQIQPCQEARNTSPERASERFFHRPSRKTTGQRKRTQKKRRPFCGESPQEKSRNPEKNRAVLWPECP